MTSCLEAVRDLAGEIGRRAPEVAAGRTLPPDLLAALTAAGCFRLVTAERHGGSGLPISRVLPVLTELGRADGSTAWVVGQVALSQLIVGCADPATVDELHRAGPDLMVAGAVAPKGRAGGSSSDPGGWTVSGRWPFVSGGRHATWFYLNCVLLDDRKVRTGADGRPQTRIVLLPADQVEIVDTWHVLGLHGTGSHDVQVTGARVPARFGVSLAGGDPAAARAATRIAESSLIIAAVAVGLAQGALDDVVAIAAAGKRPALSGRRLADSEVFQDRLGEAHTVLRGAAALLAEAGRDAPSPAPVAVAHARLRAAAAHVTMLAVSVVDTAYALAGGTAVYDTSPLQARLRDARTASQHFTAGREAFRVVGELLADHPEPVVRAGGPLTPAGAARSSPGARG